MKIRTTTYLYWILILFHGLWFLLLHEAYGLDQVFANKIKPYLLLDVFPEGSRGWIFLGQLILFIILTVKEIRAFKPSFEEQPFRLVGYFLLFFFLMTLFIQLTVLVFGPLFEKGVA